MKRIPYQMKMPVDLYLKMRARARDRGCDMSVVVYEYLDSLPAPDKKKAPDIFEAYQEFMQQQEGTE